MFICLWGLDWELLIVHSQEVKRPQHPCPLPRYKDNQVGSAVAWAMAQVRVEPSENPVLGYKLTCGRVMHLENQATPCKVGHNHPVEKLKLCASFQC